MFAPWQSSVLSRIFFSSNHKVLPPHHTHTKSKEKWTSGGPSHTKKQRKVGIWRTLSFFFLYKCWSIKWQMTLNDKCQTRGSCNRSERVGLASPSLKYLIKMQNMTQLPFGDTRGCVFLVDSQGTLWLWVRSHSESQGADPRDSGLGRLLRWGERCPTVSSSVESHRVNHLERHRVHPLNTTLRGKHSSPARGGWWQEVRVPTTGCLCHPGKRNWPLSHGEVHLCSRNHRLTSPWAGVKFLPWPLSVDLLLQPLPEGLPPQELAALLPWGRTPASLPRTQSHLSSTNQCCASSRSQESKLCVCADT
jgi:hypothetical protein